MVNTWGQLLQTVRSPADRYILGGHLGWGAVGSEVITFLEAKTFSKIAVGQSDQTVSCSEASFKVRALSHSPWMSRQGVSPCMRGSSWDNSTRPQITIWRETQRHAFGGAWAARTDKRGGKISDGRRKRRTGGISPSVVIPLLRDTKKLRQAGVSLRSLSLALKGQERLTDILEYQPLALVLWQKLCRPFPTCVRR